MLFCFEVLGLCRVMLNSIEYLQASFYYCFYFNPPLPQSKGIVHVNDGVKFLERMSCFATQIMEADCIMPFLHFILNAVAKGSFLQKRWFNLAKEIFYRTLKDILDTGAH